MTEDQILYQISLNEELGYAWLQWWGTLSLGLFAISHFAQRRLNLFFVVAILIAYWTFTVLTTYFMGLYRAANIAYLRDLQSLERVAEGTKTMIEAYNEPSGGVAFALLYITVIVGASAYLIYSYIHHRRSR